MNKYILASSNQNKHLEISSKLNNVVLLNLKDLGYRKNIIESGSTLKENALIKAREIYKEYNTSCISDDTGLEVNALNGAPGVFSARYAGVLASAEENMKKLLNSLNNIQDRRASFRTVICLKTKCDEMFFEGVVSGVITAQPIGKSGFGYDPIFKPDGYTKTFAEMSLNMKNKISHRSIALSKLTTYLNTVN